MREAATAVAQVAQEALAAALAPPALMAALVDFLAATADWAATLALVARVAAAAGWVAVDGVEMGWVEGMDLAVEGEGWAAGKAMGAAAAAMGAEEMVRVGSTAGTAAEAAEEAAMALAAAARTAMCSCTACRQGATQWQRTGRS